MSEKFPAETMSRRRVISALTAFGFAIPATVLMGSDAEAQTSGMTRRQDRRTGRHERRDDRRTGRTDRREDRRTGGTDSAPK